MRSVPLLLMAALLAGCRGAPAATPTLSATPTPQVPIPADGPFSTLTLVPASATVVTVTDLDQVRVRFGVPELTSQDPMTDRNAFWERADAEAVLLTDGLFRADSSHWELDYGFTEDDVDWEVRWTGPDGPGYAVAFRPDLDLALVQRAVRKDPALDGAILYGHLLEKGTETDGHSWADQPLWGDLIVPDAESAYLRQGCVPVDQALGDAAADDPLAEQARLAVPDLQPLERWSVSFEDGLVTALLGTRRTDVVARTDLGRSWPATDTVRFTDGFAQPVDDPHNGRIGYRVRHPLAAASLTLAEELPFAVCNTSVPEMVPTGL